MLHGKSKCVSLNASLFHFILNEYHAAVLFDFIMTKSQTSVSLYKIPFDQHCCIIASILTLS